MILRKLRMTQASYRDRQQPAPPFDPTTADEGDSARSDLVGNATVSGTDVSDPADTPCFLHDVFAALHEAAEEDADVTSSSLARFGICSGSNASSVLSDLSQAIKGKYRSVLEAVNPSRVRLSEDRDSGAVTLTVDVPQSALLKRKPVLFLAFEGVLRAEDLDVTFTSLSLRPSSQSVCISEGTQYVILTVKSSADELPQTWNLSATTKSPDKGRSLKHILIGGKSGRNFDLTTFLLVFSETGANPRSAMLSGSSASFSFLCELKRFLRNLLPQDHLGSSPIQLDSLQSLPSVQLGVSSSETLLAGLLNSSAPMILSFNSRGSVLKELQGELVLSPGLQEEIRLRLEQRVMQVTKLITDEDVDHIALKSIRRLTEFSTFPKKEQPTGERQFCAFILLKALKTVSRVYEVQRGLRATRADHSNPQREHVCSLKSLTVSLRQLIVDPDTATINNCHGSCAFPLVRANNHAILLDSYISNGNAQERAPCCVPSAYDPLEVFDLKAEGIFLSIKPNVVAKECECR
ncbi:muellerian-inhibiting factor [Thalassophryne amazonica]|uniref:muellerian-inhibiting factor n=1 Tax=Thalassophryne amazonica TaxID=390379 RepID=UPI0014723DC5|nr:muellerian-inhibiting factor [Thalassophryne amazonica]